MDISPSKSPDSQPSSELPATHFASPERSSDEQLRRELGYLESDPVIDGLMRAMVGLVAVLNENRQVLSLNTHLLKMLGITDSSAVLGLRVGELVGCIHANKGPAGCGTTVFCSTCGAAIAQVTSLAGEHAVERTCAIDLRHPINGANEIYFRVQACPIRRGNRQILLLFMQDISDEQRRALLERTFFHDIRNTLCAIVTASDLLAMDTSRPDAAVANALVSSTRRLTREIELQRWLTGIATERFEREDTPIIVGHLLSELGRLGGSHPAAAGKKLSVEPFAVAVPILRSDPTLVHRVLMNMIVNAYEATAPGGTVRLWAEAKPDAVVIRVWNEAVIPPEITRRVFQRNFSTKGTLGRGLGTYSMKIIAERMLGGSVGFASAPGEGTCFWLSLPLSMRPRAR